VEEAPGDSSDFVEEIEGSLGAGDVDGASLSEEAKVGVGFLCGAVGDAPMVQPVSTGSTVAFRKIGGDG
jgi:hypothetical protein